jgi:hypothetical protein
MNPNTNHNSDININIDIDSHNNNESTRIIQESIESISKQYKQLNDVESVLMKEYDKLVKEEKILRQSVQQSKESSRDRMIREKKEKEEYVLNRLEEALMMGSDSDSSSDDDEGEKGNDLAQALESDDSSSDGDIDEEELLRTVML